MFISLKLRDLAFAKFSRDTLVLDSAIFVRPNSLSGCGPSTQLFSKGFRKQASTLIIDSQLRMFVYSGQISKKVIEFCDLATISHQADRNVLSLPETNQLKVMKLIN